jgi:hypothetical protein
MGESRMRMKYGEHEFDAEGAPEWVERQFLAFRQIVVPTAVGSGNSSDKPPITETLKPIFRQRGRIVSVAVTANPQDAALVVLLGQRLFRSNDAVSGGDLMDGLRESGISIRRVDYILQKHVRDGFVVGTGQRRRRRYKLTTAGIDRSRQISETLISQVP